MRAQRTGPAVLRPIRALILRLPVTQRIGPAVLRPIRALVNFVVTRLCQFVCQKS